MGENDLSGKGNGKLKLSYRFFLWPRIDPHPPIPFSSEEALALMMDLTLSVRQYHHLRICSKGIGSDIYPSYNNVWLVKQQCYPPNLKVTERAACVSLRDLVFHTADRLLSSLPESTLNITETNVSFIVKWGRDGSSGHAQYRQSFSDGTTSDGSLFMTCIVPLRIHAAANSETVYWNNPKPSSTW